MDLEFDEEEFETLAYSYRAWPLSDPEGVVKRYMELLEYVKALWLASH